LMCSLNAGSLWLQISMSHVELVVWSQCHVVRPNWDILCDMLEDPEDIHWVVTGRSLCVVTQFLTYPSQYGQRFIS
jgi:hypothetical protein